VAHSENPTFFVDKGLRVRPPVQLVEPSDYGLVATPALTMAFPEKQFQWGFKVPAT